MPKPGTNMSGGGNALGGVGRQTNVNMTDSGGGGLAVPASGKPTGGSPTGQKLAEVQARIDAKNNPTGTPPPNPTPSPAGGTMTAPSATTPTASETMASTAGAPDENAAANTTSRLTQGVDMSEKIKEANNAWQQATQNYGSTVKGIEGNYGDATRQGIDSYERNVNGITDAFSSAVGNAASQYKEASSANTDQFSKTATDVINRLDTMTARELADYAKASGQTIDEFLRAAQSAADKYGQASTGNTNSYESSANDIISKLSNLSAQELADYAANTGKTISEAARDIDAILAGLQDTLKPADVGRVGRVDTVEEENLLRQIVDSQKEQSQRAIDYNVERSANELRRAEEDAQAQFQAQRDQIAGQERTARDNQALYSEMRGDRGGIGQAQYDAIANTAATNQLTVNKEQTKLATDTARQIADLRAQGEFQKADELLKITQSYLSQLMQLKQWADETNVGIDEFNIGVEQWEQEYNAKIQQALAGLQMDATQYKTGLDLDRQQYLTGQRLNAANTEASMGMSAADRVAAMRESTAANLANMERSTASDTASMRQNREQYLTGQQLSAARESANLGMNRASTEASMRERTAANAAEMDRSNATNTANMALSNANSVQQQRQALNDALAQYGLADAKYMSEADVNRIANILSAYQQNAQNMASTEMSAAGLTGAFSDATQTVSAREAQADRLAKAAQQMIEAGVNPTDAQLQGLGWNRDQYNAYKSAMDAAAARRGGSVSKANQLYSQVQTLIKGGVQNEIINDYINQHALSQSYTQADVDATNKLWSDAKSGGYNGKADYSG